MLMRDVFCNTLIKLMKSDKNIVVIDADLAKADGTMPVRKAFPKRALDVGIAEQNMASIAAGLSSYGFKPYITTFTPFATRRICDQIAISIAYAKQNVKIIGTDPGISAELNGGTHMSVEDIGVLRSIPDMVIFEPVDAVQLEKALPVINAYDGPVYIRLFRKEQPEVFGPKYRFDLFKADVLEKGRDVTVFASGIMVAQSLEARRILKEKGVDAEIVNVHTLKPIDADTVLSSVAKTGCAVTAENHNVIGGLGSAVKEVVSEVNPIPVISVGIPDCFGEVGKMPYLKEKFKMTVSDIVAAAEKAVFLKK